LRRTARKKGFVICIQNRGADDLDVWKVYRVLEDRTASTEGYLRVIDASGEDYLYPDDYFVSLPLPPKVRRALTKSPRRRRTVARPARTSRTRLA
jgi:hypothetical protein